MPQHPAFTTRRALIGFALGLCGIAARVPAARASAPAAKDTGGTGEISLQAKLQAALGLDARAVSVWFADSAWQAPSGLANHLDLERIRASSLPELRAHLRERIQADYHAGRTISARGWRLAVTEAAVLSAIYHDQRCVA